MRESDIRPADILETYLKLSAEDARDMLAQGSALQHRQCPGCGASDHIEEFDKSGFTYVRCQRCKSLFANPAPSSAALRDLYRSSPSAAYWANTFFPSVAEARRELIFAPRAKEIRNLAEALKIDMSCVVDVGAGAGLFLQELSKLSENSSLCAVEPGSDLAAECRRLGFKTFEGFSEQAVLDDEWKGCATLVTSFEVIEHVVHPEDLIADMKNFAGPNGTIFLTGLCADGYDIQALRENSHAVSPPHHLTFLSRQGVASLLERCGLEEIHFSTPGKLDVDIVSNSMDELPDQNVSPFVKWMATEANDQVRTDFQSFLVTNNMSSHMWFAARRAG